MSRTNIVSGAPTSFERGFPNFQATLNPLLLVFDRHEHSRGKRLAELSSRSLSPSLLLPPSPPPSPSKSIPLARKSSSKSPSIAPSASSPTPSLRPLLTSSASSFPAAPASPPPKSKSKSATHASKGTNNTISPSKSTTATPAAAAAPPLSASTLALLPLPAPSCSETVFQRFAFEGFDLIYKCFQLRASWTVREIRDHIASAISVPPLTIQICSVIADHPRPLADDETPLVTVESPRLSPSPSALPSPRSRGKHRPDRPASHLGNAGHSQALKSSLLISHRQFLCRRVQAPKPAPASTTLATFAGVPLDPAMVALLCEALHAQGAPALHGIFRLKGDPRRQKQLLQSISAALGAGPDQKKGGSDVRKGGSGLKKGGSGLKKGGSGLKKDVDEPSDPMFELLGVSRSTSSSSSSSSPFSSSSSLSSLTTSPSFSSFTAALSLGSSLFLSFSQEEPSPRTPLFPSLPTPSRRFSSVALGFDQASLHDLANILKKYLREQRDPLVPFADYPAWIHRFLLFDTALARPSAYWDAVSRMHVPSEAAAQIAAAVYCTPPASSQLPGTTRACSSMVANLFREAAAAESLASTSTGVSQGRGHTALAQALNWFVHYCVQHHLILAKDQQQRPNNAEVFLHQLSEFLSLAEDPAAASLCFTAFSQALPQLSLRFPFSFTAQLFEPVLQRHAHLLSFALSQNSESPNLFFPLADFERLLKAAMTAEAANAFVRTMKKHLRSERGHASSQQSVSLDAPVVAKEAPSRRKEGRKRREKTSSSSSSSSLSGSPSSDDANITTAPEHAAQMAQLAQPLIAQLSLERQQILQSVLQLCASIAQQAIVNNMPASNLAAMLAPSLMRQNDESSDVVSHVEAIKRECRVVELLILSARYLYPPMPTASSDFDSTADQQPSAAAVNLIPKLDQDAIRLSRETPDTINNINHNNNHNHKTKNNNKHVIKGTQNSTPGKEAVLGGAVEIIDLSSLQLDPAPLSVSFDKSISPPLPNCSPSSLDVKIQQTIAKLELMRGDLAALRLELREVDDLLASYNSAEPVAEEHPINTGVLPLLRARTGSRVIKLASQFHNASVDSARPRSATLIAPREVFSNQTKVKDILSRFN